MNTLNDCNSPQLMIYPSNPVQSLPLRSSKPRLAFPGILDWASSEEASPTNAPKASQLTLALGRCLSGSRHCTEMLSWNLTQVNVGKVTSSSLELFMGSL